MDAQVLQNVRLPLLSPKFLVGIVSVDPFIHNDEACRDLVDEAKNYLLLPQERPLMQGPRTKPRRPITREVLFAVGGEASWFIVEGLRELIEVITLKMKCAIQTETTEQQKLLAQRRFLFLGVGRNGGNPP